MTFWRRQNYVCVSRSVMSSCLRPHGLWPPGSSMHGILQARVLAWVAIPFSRESFQPRDWTQVSCIKGRFFTSRMTREETNTIWFQLYDILEKTKRWRQLKGQLLAGVWKEERRDEGVDTEGFQGSETILHDTPVVDTWHYALVRTLSMHNTARSLVQTPGFA